MKKNTKLQTGVLVALAIIIGFLAGLFIEYPKTDNKDITGTIGKADRYRNVKITEEDLDLRNELVEDTAKQTTYVKYLNYYYYLAMRTTSDVERVLNMTGSVDEFADVSRGDVDRLTKHESYLATARADILNALNMVTSLDKSKEVPIINYLNKAQNAISRIRHGESTLTKYMETINELISANPETNYPKLEEAHDILTITLLQSAAVNQSKPMLTYLKDKDLYSNKSELNALLDVEQFGVFMSDQMSRDMQKLDIKMSAEQLGVFDAEQIGMFFDVEQLGVFDAENLGLFDAEKLGALFDAENLGLFDAEKLGWGVL